MFMAIDQYGQTYHGLKHPRKDLLAQFGVKHADKMYVDKKDGSTKHVGYIIAGHWCRIFEVKRWEKNA